MRSMEEEMRYDVERIFKETWEKHEKEERRRAEEGIYDTMIRECAMSMYSGQRVFTAAGGTGYAAEHANHMSDVFRMNDAQLVSENIKNGPDRIVNGEYIQSKYYPSGKQCVDATMNLEGEFRYYTAEGSPMKIEVPSDKYDEAVYWMEDKISKGTVSGVRDPKEARNIIKKGYYTYDQARGIARWGTIEGLKFDMKTGAVVSAYSMSISGIMAYGLALWRGCSGQEAFAYSMSVSLRVGVMTWATHIIGAQIGRTPIDGMMVDALDPIMDKISHGTASKLAAAYGYQGAGAKRYVNKVVRSSVLGLAIQTGLYAVPDMWNFIQSRVSFKQVVKKTSKNAIQNGIRIAAYGIWSFCTSGWWMIARGVSLIAAWAGAEEIVKSVDELADSLIEDDGVEMLRIFNSVISAYAKCYMMSKEEVEVLKECIGNSDMEKICVAMYASKDRYQHAVKVLRKTVESILLKRDKVDKNTVEVAMEEAARR